MKENRKLEYKENVTNTFLKTVSAFANYDGGTIIFGVDDNGKVVGLEDLDQQCLEIENRINDSIKPKLDYSISTNNSEKTISLDVESGIHKPYLYKSKAYKRNDTATVEVSSYSEIDFDKRAIADLDGENVDWVYARMYDNVPVDVVVYTYTYNVAE